MVRKVERIRKGEYVDIKDLRTREDVANLLGEDLVTIETELEKGVERYYCPFKIPKKRRGEWRDITAPMGPKMYKRWTKKHPEKVQEAIERIGCSTPEDTMWLYEKQATLLYKVFYRCRISNKAHGFTMNRSTATGAEFHTNKEIVVEIDLENFFPNINKDQVVKALAINGIGPEAASLIADICIYQKGLPQGAVTSPAISNIVARKLDYRLTGLARKHNFKYSRYADNIFFSGENELPKKLGQIFAIVSDQGFLLHEEKKAKLTRKGNRQTFCGWTVNEGVAYPRRKLRLFRAILHNVTKNGVEAELKKFNEKFHKNYSPNKFRNYLRGIIALMKMAPNSRRYAEQFEQQFSDYFCQKVRIALTDDDE